jgi:PAS domain S-box-containing protein
MHKMENQDKTKEQLMNELAELRQRVAELEAKDTRCKRAEEALKESEQHYRQLFEGIGDAVMVYSSQGRFLDCNEATLKRLGYRREELLRLGTANIVHPDFHQLMRDNQERIWAGETTVVESAHRCKDGRVIPVEVHVRRIEYRGEPAILGMVRDITERKWVEEELQQGFEKLQRTFEGTVNVLVSVVEIRDPYTAGHQRRVTQLACAIAKEMGLSEGQIGGIRMAGLIHDIGKINVPAEILSKPGPLTELEYGLIKMHPQVGYDILNGTIEFPWPVAQIILQHHERMDGSGYPQRLSGEDILLEARILGVADVIEAMASHRPYRSALGIDKALEETSQNKGVLYDPEVVDVCSKLFTAKGFEFK